MKIGLSLQALAELDVLWAVLGVGGYALPVRFRVESRAVACRVPSWSGVADLLEQAEADATLVAAVESGPFLRWLYVRGRASRVSQPNWGGLALPGCERISPDDLYQMVRLEPSRLELVDEERGWGVRETCDW